MALSKREFKNFLQAFNSDSKYLVDYDEIAIQTIQTADHAAYRFRRGEKPTVAQIVATRSALAYSTDGFTRLILKNLLDAEEYAF